MNNQITIKVEGRLYTLQRNLLLSESQNQQIHNNTNFTLPLPQWVTLEVYLLIQKYLRTKDVSFMFSYINNRQIIVKVLRTSDYLGMNKFHDIFINKILIPEINCHNCIVLLEESHKKLKNADNSQSWFNLLNMSINFLSSHIFQVFKQTPEQLKKLNQKILNQIFDRVIRSQRKNQFIRKKELFQLLIQCQQTKCGYISNLFRHLYIGIKNKKIHAKIHAKLSWKLENIPQINEKKTKNFKFLDLMWYLSALRKPEKGLMVSLNLISSQNSQNQSVYESRLTENTEKTEKTESQKSKKVQKSISLEKPKESLDQLIHDQFTKIGVFYSKLTWKNKDQNIQKQTIIHYVIMNEAQPLSIFLFDTKLSQKLGKTKIQLTIYCNLDQIYTFSLNYVLHNFDKLQLKGSDFCKEELQALVFASKKMKNYSQALQITNELFINHPIEKPKNQYSTGYDFTNMTKIELQKYTSILGKPYEFQYMLNKEKAPPKLRKDDIKFKEIIYQVGNQRNQSRKNETDETKEVKSVFSEREQRISRAQSRGQSRGSKKKIFSRRAEKSGRQSLLTQQMLRVTDLTKYINKNVDPQTSIELIQFLGR